MLCHHLAQNRSHPNPTFTSTPSRAHTDTHLLTRLTWSPTCPFLPTLYLSLSVTSYSQEGLRPWDEGGVRGCETEMGRKELGWSVPCRFCFPSSSESSLPFTRFFSLAFLGSIGLCDPYTSEAKVTYSKRISTNLLVFFYPPLFFLLPSWPSFTLWLSDLLCCCFFSFIREQRRLTFVGKKLLCLLLLWCCVMLWTLPCIHVRPFPFVTGFFFIFPFTLYASDFFLFFTYSFFLSLSLLSGFWSLGRSVHEYAGEEKKMMQPCGGMICCFVFLTCACVC